MDAPAKKRANVRAWSGVPMSVKTPSADGVRAEKAAGLVRVHHPARVEDDEAEGVWADGAEIDDRLVDGRKALQAD
ncbi:MAG: hypothetical protein HOO96_13945 [Polyangiaceae bacterium]|nr:hypothetical protein [Polyangiaceae bacterium]